MLRLPKNISILVNYVAGPFLFCWLSYRIYTELAETPHLARSWQGIKASFAGTSFFYLPAVLLLMLVNWILEAAKWQRVVQVLQPIGLWTAFKAVLSGLSFAVTTPNRVGEYLGRMLYLPEGRRLQVVSLTLVCSLAQILITAWAGLFAFLFLKSHLLTKQLISPRFAYWAPVLLLLGATVLTAFYAALPLLEKTSERYIKWPLYVHLVRAVGILGPVTQWYVLALSALRYAVFIVQYILLFRLFEVFVPVQQLAAVTALQFLILAVVPTVALAELGLRGELSLQLLGMFSANAVGALLTSVSMWAINLVVPAAAGSLLLLTVRIIRKKEAGPVSDPVRKKLIKEKG